jgi:hypothetical protein
MNLPVLAGKTIRGVFRIGIKKGRNWLVHPDSLYFDDEIHDMLHRMVLLHQDTMKATTSQQERTE